MLKSLTYLFIKVLILLIIVLAYYLITKYTTENNTTKPTDTNPTTLEAFEDMIEKEKNNYLNYLKLKETYIEPEGTTLELLYTNYSGEEVNKEVWEGKTLEQCIDTCNNMEKCVGFNRDNVLDTEPSKCYPRSKVQSCHSNRKGDYNQMNKSLKYNSYVKENVSNIINTCIGDTELTLNRIILLKTYSTPNKYIGNNGSGRVSIIDKNTNDFKKNCNFRIEIGKDGIGTVSFLHIDTNKYLYRDINNNIIFKSITDNNTEQNIRSSFNILDGISNGIMIKSLPIDGETTDKYIILNNTYLKISTLNKDSNNKDHKNNKNNKNKSIPESLATFYIVDTVINSDIIDDKNKIKQNINLEPTIANTGENTVKNTVEAFTTTLDTSNNILLYNTIFNKDNNENNNININNYLYDNYLKKDNNFISISKKINDDMIKTSLSKDIKKNEEQYYLMNELNREIEKEIANQNINLNVKNDKIINNLDKMRITDLSNDYFFLKSLLLK